MKGRLFGAGDPELEILAAQAREAALMPGQLEHEIDWVVDSDHGPRVSAGVLGLFEGERLAGYLPFRYRADGLLFRVAGVHLGRLPYRTIELFGPGVVTHEEHVIQEALSRLQTMPWPYHAVAVHEAPTASPLWQAIANGGASGYRTLRRASAVHHLLDLPASFQVYLERFSSKTRGTWKRKARKLEAEVGPLRLEVFTAPDQVVRLLELIEPVFRQTYHYHLLARDLSPKNQQLVHNLTAWAQRSWLRGYLLFAGDRAVAYVIGCLARRRYSYDLPGYDPRLQAFSPGFLLLLRIIEELIEAGAGDLLDFGSGHADYKELLATRSYPEVSALLVRRTPYAQGVAYLQRGMLATAHGGAQFLEALRLKSRVKNWMRGWRLRPV